MPVNRFWLLNANIDRISAQEDSRAAHVCMTPHITKEGVTDYFDGLKKEIGLVVDRVDEPDLEGIKRLKALAASFSAKRSI